MRTVCSWEAARDPTGMPPFVRPPTCPSFSPLAHLLAPFSCLFDFSICWPSKKKKGGKRKKQQQQAQLLGQSQRQLGPQFPFGFAFMSCSSSCSLLLYYSKLLLSHSSYSSPPHLQCGCGFRTHRVSRAARSHFNAFLSFAAKQVQFSPQKQQQTAAAAAATTTTNNNNNRQQLQIHEN